MIIKQSIINKTPGHEWFLAELKAIAFTGNNYGLNHLIC
jgi:hypothetical protein